jgi:hypothetical protein
MKDMQHQMFFFFFFFVCTFSCSFLWCWSVVLTSFACVVCGEIHLLSAFVSYDIDVLCKRVNSADNFCYMCVEKSHLLQRSVL